MKYIKGIDGRQPFSIELVHHSDERFEFTDEKGYNLYTSANFGYSQKNVKDYSIFPANKGTKISLMTAITCDGVWSYELNDGAYSAEKCNDFIERSLKPYLKDHPNQN